MKEKEPKTPPKYYTLIPASVRYSKNICAGAKLLYGEILTLSAQNGYCGASNKYWATLFGVDDKTISEWVRQLTTVEFVRSVILKNYQRKLYPKYAHITEKKPTGVSAKAEGAPSGKPDKINTSINNKTNMFSENKSHNEQDSSKTTESNYEDIGNWTTFLKSSLEKARDGYSYVNKHNKTVHIKPNHARYFALYFFKRKGISFKSSRSVEAALKRHYKAAKVISEFISDIDKVREAFDKTENAIDQRGRGLDWTLETVVKYLTK